jgi:AraC family transcriptional regulator
MEFDMHDMPPSIAPKRIIEGRARLLAGLATPLTGDPSVTIPALWERFGRETGIVPHLIGTIAFGVCTPARDGMHYAAAIEVTQKGALPEGWDYIELPPQRYAVFPHTGNVMTLRGTIHSAGEWLQSSGRDDGNAKHFLERYGEGFDAASGAGDIEVWMPVR